MASAVRTLLLNPRPLRSLATARPRRAYATIPTKNTKPTVPMEASREQAMPIGAFYEAILNTPQPIPDVKPEEPATSVKENLRQAAAAEPEPEPESNEAPAPAARRGRKPKAKTEPAATATASAAPTASPAANQRATAKQAAAKSSVSTPSLDLTRAGEGSPSSPSPSSSSSSSATLEFSSPPAPTPPPTTTSTEDKAKVIFGSRLAGPAERAERLAQIRSRSKLIAGVLVPPRPEEPDNCCMSGCVNCVWDRYRDEMEEWALANTEAERRAAAGRAGDEEKEGKNKPGADTTTAPSVSKQHALDHTRVSMDDDGGGSDTNWDVGTTADGQGPGKIAKDFWDDELYKNVPVGIREFMKQEKRLKDKHMREGSSGG